MIGTLIGFGGSVGLIYLSPDKSQFKPQLKCLLYQVVFMLWLNIYLIVLSKPSSAAEIAKIITHPSPNITLALNDMDEAIADELVKSLKRLTKA